METKTCKKCGVEKPLIGFTSKHNTCKQCILGPSTKSKKAPKSYNTKGQVEGYANFITKDLTGNDY